MEAAYFMREAIREAKLAEAAGEVPVGCVIVFEDRIVGRGHNTRRYARNALGHAEITAIDEACKTIGGWRLLDCDMYVTLEPCPMCAGAVVNARIRTVYFGAFDPKAGCFGSVIHFNDLPFNYKPVIIGGVLEEECGAMLSDFFRAVRQSLKEEKNHESGDV